MASNRNLPDEHDQWLASIRGDQTGDSSRLGGQSTPLPPDPWLDGPVPDDAGAPPDPFGADDAAPDPFGADDVVPPADDPWSPRPVTPPVPLPQPTPTDDVPPIPLPEPFTPGPSPIPLPTPLPTDGAGGADAVAGPPVGPQSGQQPTVGPVTGQQPGVAPEPPASAAEVEPRPVSGPSTGAVVGQPPAPQPFAPQQPGPAAPTEQHAPRPDAPPATGSPDWLVPSPSQPTWLHSGPQQPAVPAPPAFTHHVAPPVPHEQYQAQPVPPQRDGAQQYQAQPVPPQRDGAQQYQAQPVPPHRDGDQPYGAPQPPPVYDRQQPQYQQPGAPAPGPYGGPQGQPVPSPQPSQPTPPQAPEPPQLPPDLSQSLLVKERRGEPERGWRRALYKASFGGINVGRSPEELKRDALVERIRKPIRGCHKIAVVSLKGGIGKTTTTACLGLTLAHYRGDRVVALDANPDAGTLAERLTGPPEVSVRDLLDDIDAVASFTDISRYMSLAERLQVLASDQDPEVSEAFDAQQYTRVTDLLGRYYNVILTDSGTGMLHSAMDGTLKAADSLVVVGAPSVDGSSRAAKTLDWLNAHGYETLVRNAVAVISSVRPRAESVDMNVLRNHFAARCRDVVEIPYDPHLVVGGRVRMGEIAAPTELAYLELAASVADGFAVTGHAAR